MFTDIVEIPIRCEEERNLDTLLRNAAGGGDLERVKALVEDGADLESSSLILGRTALSISAITGQHEIAKFLLEKGANPLALDNSGLNPLYYAKFFGNQEIIKLFEDHLRVAGEGNPEPAKKDEQGGSVIDQGVGVLVLDGSEKGT